MFAQATITPTGAQPGSVFDVKLVAREDHGDGAGEVPSTSVYSDTITVPLSECVGKQRVARMWEEGRGSLGMLAGDLNSEQSLG